MSATIHFYIRSERPLSDKSAQLYLLFTINRRLKAKISLGKKIAIKKEFEKLSLVEIANFNPDLRNDLFCWDNRLERATKQAPNAEKINRFLDSEKKRANDLILKYELMGKPLTIEAFKKMFCRNTGNLLFSEYFLQELENNSGRWSEETLRSYRSIVTKIQQFKPNLSLNDIDHKFLMEYESYMQKSVAGGGCGNSWRTVANNMKTLRTLVIIAIRNGDLPKENYAFEDYRIRDMASELTSRDYLEPDELASLEELYNKYIPINKNYKTLTDSEWREREEAGIITPGEHAALRRFLFSCYTGLRFRDMLLLDRRKHIFSKNIGAPSSGEKINRCYIELSMHKTQNIVVVPLIDKAIKLIDMNKSGRIFEAITNQKMNEHLKNIQKKAKLNKYLTFHVSRHSFATICFLYGIHEKIGQQLLGHKNRKFTEIYTHLSSHKLFLEMDKFNDGINRLNEKTVSNNPKTDAKIFELLPLMKNLNEEKIEQLKGLLKLLG